MPLYFRNMPVREPFAINSAGYHWIQDPIFRPKGYPMYHFLQTEKGQGNFEVQGKVYSLNEGEGILLAPFVPHAYYAVTREWLTSTAAITGTSERHIADMLGGRQVIFTNARQGEKIDRIFSDIARQFESSPLDAKSLSIHCYRLLLNFIDGGYDQDLNQEPCICSM